MVALSFQLSAFSFQLSAFGFLLSAFASRALLQGSDTGVRACELGTERRGSNLGIVGSLDTGGRWREARGTSFDEPLVVCGSGCVRQVCSTPG